MDDNPYAAPQEISSSKMRQPRNLRWFVILIDRLALYLTAVSVTAIWLALWMLNRFGSWERLGELLWPR